MKTNTTEPTLESRIAELTGIVDPIVRDILYHKSIGKPTDIPTAKQIIVSYYATDEQKTFARSVWAELSGLEIALARNFNEAKEAYYSIDRSNVNIVLRAVKKLIACAKNTSDITVYTSHRASMPNDVQTIHNQIIRQALLERVVDLRSAISIWRDFDFTNTEEGDLLVEKTRVFIESYKATTPMDHSFVLFNWLPKGHSLRMETLMYGINNCKREDILRGLLDNCKKELKALEAVRGLTLSCESDKKFLQEALPKVSYALDLLLMRSVDKKTNEDILLETFKQARLDKLMQTTIWTRRCLINLWQAKLDSGEEMSLDYAIATFKNTMDVAEGREMPLLTAKYWNLANQKAEGKAGAERMLEAAGYSEYRKEAIRSWLIYDPTFEELYEKYKTNELEILESAMIKKADTFERAISLAEYSSDRDWCQIVAKNLADKISSLEQGASAIQKCSNGHYADGPRALVLEATLKFVTSRFDLGALAKYLGDGYGRQDGERLLLVEKVLELLGETYPPTEVESKSSDTVTE